MLELTIGGKEWFNESTGEFFVFPEHHLTLEHSLLSVSKWESKWRIPFLDDKTPKTLEQSVDYIRCMAIGKAPAVIDPRGITQEQMQKVNNYIGDTQTATFVRRRTKSRPPVREPITSELIYYWMVTYNIPFECQKWHLSRLLTLVDVCVFKNEKPEKMSSAELAKRNRAINKARCAKHHTRG